MATTGSKLINCSDAELVSLAQGGNQGAFLVLYDRHKAGIFVYVSSLVTLREEVEDIVLESFQKAFSQISTYNDSYRFSTWLFRIARNTALDHIDKNVRGAGTLQAGSIDDETSGLVNVLAAAGNPEASVINSQEYDELVSAIDGLSETYRMVARMILLDNYGYKEVSDELELPLGTVKTRIKRAKDLIAKALNIEEEDL